MSTDTTAEPVTQAEQSRRKRFPAPVMVSRLALGQAYRKISDIAMAGGIIASGQTSRQDLKRGQASCTRPQPSQNT